MGKLRFLLLLLMSAVIFAAAPALSDTQGENEFSTPLKDLNERFTKQSTGTRDYQELRSIRSDLRKLIPTIRARFEESVKQSQIRETQLNLKKQALLYYLIPQPTNPKLSPTFGQPTIPIDDSGESLKRRVAALQASIPKQMDETKKEIEKIEDNIKNLGELAKVKGAKAQAQNQIQDYQESLEQKKSDLNRLVARQGRLDDNSNAADDIISSEKALADAQRNQQLLQKQAVDAETLLDRLDERAQSSLSNDNAQNIFTMISTISFAVLVGFIIFFFFRIANSSDTVKNAIFAGESGIQFVTLFSVVIAIILFGVLRILEGKELSALLGGLSGYILGRGSNRKDQAIDPPQGNQPGNQPA